MKRYLEHLADELDVVFTQLEGENDWREIVIETIYKNLKAFQVYKEGTLDELFRDMEEGIRQ